ncbi:tyrosine-type recombinase/integrase [Phenylobacterium sp. J426]|uniref:tyrosine-type recombinase/integrase n=1 Tax=Phenylobacterium sp. J426 TaxID=2898439 RepID=UPI0021510507|nr:site-specific integrase [Phenylobacterium sp. J426]MCR5874231.1 tyrosine-type recombinase/integrase [Phenylobacterium sp. J426]
MAKKPGMHCDGAGLYLRVAPPSAASWVLRYMLDGKARTMGLGPFPEIDLKEARTRALEARRLKADGIDPIETRNAAKLAQRRAATKAMTFKECAEAYIASQRDGWRNDKHAAQWDSTLKAYAYPIIGGLPVAAIDTALVMQVLEQEVGAANNRQRLWSAKNETASRVRGRIECVLGWAAARQLRSGDNPARWKGHLAHQLPARSKVSKVKHHPALPYVDMPTFFAALRDQPGLAAKALEFAILTAARTGEVLGARWGEIDIANKVWIVPAERMKSGREHRVPLSDRAIAVLKPLSPEEGAIDSEGYVFPGAKTGKPLSNMSMLKLLERMKRSDLTAHGFRSTFRDWTAEQTSTPRDVAEMALAHVVSNAVEAAYRRGDMLAKRIELMDSWSAYCASKLDLEASDSSDSSDISEAG